VLEEDAREKRGEPEDGFGIVLGADTEEEEAGPNTDGRFGREAGSVLWQLLIANRINNANP
jgi:hypothetical protein